MNKLYIIAVAATLAFLPDCTNIHTLDNDAMSNSGKGTIPTQTLKPNANTLGSTLEGGTLQ